jgi:hypothetical protein
MKREQIMAQQNDAIKGKRDRRIALVPEKVRDRVLPALPIRIVYEPSSIIPSAEKRGEEVIFRFRHGESADFGEGGVDAFSLRDAFLTVKTPGEALDFLALGGAFRDDDADGNLRDSMTWRDFQRWQEIVRIVLTRGALPLEQVSESEESVCVRYAVPDDLCHILSDLSSEERGWLFMFPTQIAIRADRRPRVNDERPRLCAEVIVDSILEAILAAVYIDGLRGVNYRLCALPDCSEVYEVFSKHERVYCSQACAHKASVRKRRAAERSLRIGAVDVKRRSGKKARK